MFEKQSQQLAAPTYIEFQNQEFQISFYKETQGKYILV